MAKKLSRPWTRIFVVVVVAVLGILRGQFQFDVDSSGDESKNIKTDVINNYAINLNVSNSGDENKIIKTDVLKKDDAIKIDSINNTLIWHLPSRQEVCVKMDFASCPYPDLIGRISGSALAHIDGWERRNQSILGFEEIHELTCGSYKNSWLSPDEYNLEIIVMLCDSFGLASPMLQRNYSQWLEYDFKQICLEDPAKNKITLNSSTLSIVDEVSGINSFLSEESVFLDGRWEMGNTAIHRPLSTRYQPRNCRDKEQKLSERCAGPMNNDYVERLNFQVRNVTILREQLKRYHPDSSPERQKLCLVGASHSLALLRGLYANDLKHHFAWISTKYPSELTTKYFEQYYNEIKCKKFIIGVGQWPASNREGQPYSFEQWRDAMTQIVTNQDIFNIDSEIELILRSIHRMPLGDMVSKCRPTDWRSPVVIDSYNAILKDIVRDANNSRVSFLDTRFITDPVWDSAPDWCHLHSKVSTVEALYIASEVLFE